MPHLHCGTEWLLKMPPKVYLSITEYLYICLSRRVRAGGGLDPAEPLPADVPRPRLPPPRLGRPLRLAPHAASGRPLDGGRGQDRQPRAPGNRYCGYT